jgi:hypothetical protein
MELKLQNFIKNCEEIAGLRNLDDTNPIKIPITHPNLGLINVVICATKEPDTMVLPLNVVWLNFNPRSNHYRKALKRISKDSSALYSHTWEVLYYFQDVFDRQYYTAEDLNIIADETMMASLASDIDHGIVRLSTPAVSPNDPVVCGDNDPRLFDARDPLPHTHPQEPTQHLRTSTNVVSIEGSTAPQPGMVLVANSTNTAVWRFLTEDDIQQV